MAAGLFQVDQGSIRQAVLASVDKTVHAAKRTEALVTVTNSEPSGSSKEGNSSGEGGTGNRKHASDYAGSNLSEKENASLFERIVHGVNVGVFLLRAVAACAQAVPDQIIDVRELVETLSLIHI